MNKYVNVEDVKDLINGLDSLPWEDEVDAMIDRLVVADIAEVVRCKDCEQFMQQYDIHNGRKLHYGICKLNSNKFHDEEVKCDHYCSFGKRKEGAEE